MLFSSVPLLILLVLVLQDSTAFVSSFTNNVTDQQALLSLKASITADPSGVLSSWNTSIHFCQWTGITCKWQRVVALNLSYQHLVGTLSPHIGNLSFITRIDLEENNFHGSIPDDIGRLFRLRDLFLDLNSFEGGFPANLSHCVEIRNIGLYDNNLRGKLPSEFAFWPRLYRLSLGKNYFTGSIPPSIGNISYLRYLDLRYNNLAGSVPLELAHHTNLKTLILAVNSFSGMIPRPLYNISSLYVVSLAVNKLEGTFPEDLGFALPKLQEFYFAENKFSGQLPSSITNASNLIAFEIAHNNITGPIPNNFGSLPNLQVLSLGRNPLGDSMRPGDLSFFNSLINCTRLKILALNENNLRGEFPNSIGNLSSTLEKLYLYGNQIYGSIPGDIGKLENMIRLLLFGNLLTGTIPESIARLSKLGALDLNKNSISGVIPTSISNITQLTFLSVESNMLQESIPTALFNISTLEKLSLANNRLRGVVPEKIAFSSNCIYLNLSQNQFTGPLTSNIGRLKHLVILDVSDNKFTGDVPITLAECVMLEVLYMGGNLFQGRIPSSFENLKNLRILDLSRNNISENIPRFFYGFHLIEFLNLSHNKLGGEVPKGGLFSNISAFSVTGNMKLCGGVQALHLPACPVKVSRNKKKTFALRLILLIVLVPLGILSACLALICYRRRNAKKFIDLVPVLKDNHYLKLSYQDLLLATNDFSQNNLLGEGRYSSVYKGFLTSAEHIVAVKVLNVEVRGANKSFLAECETLRNIRHRNLIKIITACSSTDFKGNDFKALVFEFMTNGSVENWLHPSPYYPGNERNLNLLQRLNISIDVAQGVDYLHHHSHASIIHSDIKPSNILLDEDFVAHIGDFGLARFSFATTSDFNQAEMSSTGGVRGTIGYVPPEYGMCGKISTEGDVYSYGILLLEIFSGKQPTESSILIDNCSNLHDYVKKALPQRVMDIVDPRIVNQSYSRDTMELCLASIFEVGILCSDETPQKRIGISVAIKQLLEARNNLLR